MADDPSGSEQDRKAAWEGLLLFAADGRLLAATSDAAGSGPPGVERLSDLEERYRQSDGMPLDLRERGRHVALPVSGTGPQVMLVSEPLTSAPPGATDVTVAVAVMPLGAEQDPQTIQRALGSILAHELRTPMTAVYGGAELLTSPGLSEAARTDTARSVARGAEHLHRVVEDLVLLVRWSPDDGADPEPVLLQPIVRAAAAWHDHGAVPIDVAIPADLPSVAGSDAEVRHLVRNLLGHAVASTPPDGRVTVRARTDGDWVELSVADGGPPLDAADRERAFDLFGPAARRGSDPSGANLTMVVARRLVQRLGGRIEAANRGHGGETIVRLPIVAAGGLEPM